MIKRIINKLIARNNYIPDKDTTPSPISQIVNLNFKDFKTVLDVGAYYGQFTEDAINKNPLVEVHAFEPSNEAYDVLKKKFQKKNIILNKNAISDFNGETDFYLNYLDLTNSLLKSTPVNDVLNRLTRNVGMQKITVITLDWYCQQMNLKNIDFLKIDTQGNSYNVLLGAHQLLTNKSIKYIYVETEFIQIYENEKCFSEIELMMKKIGYQVVNLYDIHYTQDGRIAWCDTLFTIR